MMTNILALETSTPSCGVALLSEKEGRIELLDREYSGTPEHAERLLPMATELLQARGLTPADLDAIAFGQGPGGFTGLRVACGVAQGMGLALNIPVVPVVAHHAVAAGLVADGALAVGDSRCVVVALDARMHEVYLAVYRQCGEAASDLGSDAWETVQEPLLISADQVVPWIEQSLPSWPDRGAPVLAGDAWAVYAQQMTPPAAWCALDQVTRPRARSVAQLGLAAWQAGQAIAPEAAAPRYVRDKVAFTTAERKQGQGGNPRAQSRIGGPLQLAAMTETDLDAVAALEARCQAFPWTRGNFADALAQGYQACVAREGAATVGFCVLMCAPDLVHVLVIGVEASHRRHGVGSALLRWSMDEARARGLDALLLEVRPSNAVALAFYTRWGFEQVGLRRGYYQAIGGREDALVLRKTITDAMFNV